VNGVVGSESMVLVAATAAERVFVGVFGGEVCEARALVGLAAWWSWLWFWWWVVEGDVDRVDALGLPFESESESSDEDEDGDVAGSDGE
jgi:hypothetical protein